MQYVEKPACTSFSNLGKCIRMMTIWWLVIFFFFFLHNFQWPHLRRSWEERRIEEIQIRLKWDSPQQTERRRGITTRRRGIKEHLLLLLLLLPPWTGPRCQKGIFVCCQSPPELWRGNSSLPPPLFRCVVTILRTAAAAALKDGSCLTDRRRRRRRKGGIGWKKKVAERWKGQLQSDEKKKKCLETGCDFFFTVEVVWSWQEPSKFLPVVSGKRERERERDVDFYRRRERKDILVATVGVRLHFRTKGTLGWPGEEGRDP